MPVRTILGALTFVACLLQIPAVMHGQSSAQSTPPAGQVFSLGATSSLVIEDVVVTDGKGHPVDNLPPIAFHVQDQTAHQKILHFEHATTASTAQRAAPDPPGEFSAWNAMDRLASETGGKAFNSTNDLTSAVAQAIDLGSHAYSISYRPTNPTSNGEWHAVKLTVDGGYTLSYRKGYFASDRSCSLDTGKSFAKDLDVSSTHPATMQPPITFRAWVTSVVPAGSHGGITLTLQYGVLLSDLLFKPDGGQHQQARIKIAALAYNGDGDVVSNAVDNVQANYDLKQMELAHRIGVPLLQKIEVAKKAKYLLLAVLDEQTGRTGTVQLTIDAAKAASR